MRERRACIHALSAASDALDTTLLQQALEGAQKVQQEQVRGRGYVLVLVVVLMLMLTGACGCGCAYAYGWLWLCLCLRVCMSMSGSIGGGCSGDSAAEETGG